MEDYLVSIAKKVYQRMKKGFSYVSRCLKTPKIVFPDFPGYTIVIPEGVYDAVKKEYVRTGVIPELGYREQDVYIDESRKVVRIQNLYLRKGEAWIPLAQEVEYATLDDILAEIPETTNHMTEESGTQQAYIQNQNSDVRANEGRRQQEEPQVREVQVGNYSFYLTKENDRYILTDGRNQLYIGRAEPEIVQRQDGIFIKAGNRMRKYIPHENRLSDLEWIILQSDENYKLGAFELEVQDEQIRKINNVEYANEFKKLYFFDDFIIAKGKEAGQEKLFLITKQGCLSSGSRIVPYRWGKSYVLEIDGERYKLKEDKLEKVGFMSKVLLRLRKPKRLLPKYVIEVQKREENNTPTTRTGSIEVEEEEGEEEFLTYPYE